MAFMLSKADQSFSDDEKLNSFNNPEDKDTQTSVNPVMISSQLHLKSSSTRALEKDRILRRIRHHRSVNKVKNAFQAMVSGSSDQAAYQKRWLDPEDAFSSP